MKAVFAPAIRLLNRLTYPRKFGLIALLFGLPLGLATGFLIGELNSRIAFSAKEQLGTEYLRPLQRFATDLRDHRTLTWGRAEHPDSAVELRRVEERLRNDVQEIDAIDARLGELLRTTSLWNEIKQSWRQLDGSASSVVPIDPANPQTRLISSVLRLMSHVGDRSNLILDPDLDSYYLMELMVNRLPQATEQIGQARCLYSAMEVKSAGVELDGLQRQFLSRLIKSQHELLRHHLDVAIAETSDASLVETLRPALDRCTAAGSRFLSLLERSSEANEPRVSPDEAWQSGSDALAEYDKLYVLSAEALDRLLQARIARFASRRSFVVIVTFLCTLLVAYLFVAFYLAVMRTIAQLDEATQRLVGGDSGDAQINVDTRDELGQVTRMFDVLAARIRTECLSLQNSEHRIRAILNGADDAVITIDEQGRIESANPATEVLFGYPAADLIGKNVKLLMPSPYREEHDGYLQRYMATHEKHVIGTGREVPAVRRDGTLFHAELSVSEVKLNDRRMFTGFVRDVSDRKKAERELEEAHAQLAGVINAATQVSIISTDTRGVIQVFNTGAQNLLGYTAEEMIGRQTPGIFHVAEEIAARGEELSRELGHPVEGFEVFVAYARLGRFDRREWTYVRKDGTRFTVNLVVTAVRNSDGEIRGFLGVAEDITLRKQTEMQLSAARESAEQTARAKSEFLANMSHEIRTPMNGIIGMTELALETSLTPEQHEYLDAVNSSANSLLRIINDILDFSKIEAGKFDLETVDFNVHETIGDVLTTLVLRAARKKLELAGRIDAAVPEVVIGDSVRLRQVLINLVGNAIKFTDRGEVVVEAEVESQSETELWLHFKVRDTGPGIPEEKQQSIFEAFVQADTSTTRKYGGTGLGLTITARLVELMGGRIWVESIVGRGSTFHFTARFGVSQSTLSSPPEVAPENVRGLPVLVVDDNATNRRIIQELLEQMQMTVTLVDCGAAAMTAIEGNWRQGEPFALVILDAHMPEIDGFMVGEWLQKHPDRVTSILMMLTSGGRNGDAARCRQLGFAAYLNKPVRRAELRRAILRALSPHTDSTVDLVAEPSASRCRPLRVLLAEDNPVNQRVAASLLEKQGHSVRITNNGREALAALDQQEFDVVLMDMQMPEMDGLEATREIRRRELRTQEHIPIIAMTAAAMKGDRERCLHSGMDGYVSKPFRVHELMDVIESFVAHPVTPEPRPDSISDVAANETVLNWKGALVQAGGDEDLLKEVAEIFLREAPGWMDQIRDALDRHDSEQLRQVSHTLRGSLTTFAAARAVEAAEQLEAMGRSNQLDGSDAAYTNLHEAVQELQKALAARIKL